MSPSITREDVERTLRDVRDPELHDDIVDLGMVRRIDVGPDGNVELSIALTVASCPLRSQIESDIRNRLLALPGVSGVDISVGAMSAPEKSALMARARLKARDDAPVTEVPARTRVIAVGSGKGGVGKSTTTANLALALKGMGHTVGVMDADIWGYSLPRILGASGRLGGAAGKIEPMDVDGLKLISMGLLVDTEGTALMWRGLVLTKAVEQFLTDVRWGDMDYLLIDLPPGTGDVQMGLSRMLPQSELLIVTTPQQVAQKVAARLGDMARRSHMPIAGVVENMSGFRCEHGSHYDIFGSGGGSELAADLHVPLLAQVPLDPFAVTCADEGTPILTAHPDAPAAVSYRGLAERIGRDLLPPIEMASCTARLDAVLASIS